MAMTLWEAREYFKTLNKRLNSLQSNLLNEVKESGKHLGEIGEEAARDRIIFLNRIDTGKMKDNVTHKSEIVNDRTVLVSVWDEVYDNPKSNYKDYVPYQEYTEYTNKNGTTKEPVRMMDRAEDEMDRFYEDVFEDTIEQAWLKTIQDEELPF